MTARTCPEWPALLDLAPGLQFKHYTAAEARLPAEALMALGGGSLDGMTICCDRDHHVYNSAHTDGAVARALRETHWFELNEWATRGPGAAAR